MRTWGALVARRGRIVVALGLVVVAAAAVFGVGVFGSLANGGFADPGSESSQENAAEQVFNSHDADVVAIYSSNDLTVSDPQFRTAVQGVVAQLPTGAVERVVSYYRTHAPDLVSDDGHYTQVIISLAGQSQDAKSESYAAIEPLLHAPGLTTHIAGQWAVFDDVNRIVSDDIARAETIAMPIVLLLSLVIFGSLVAALMPVLVGGIAVFGALAVVRLISGVTDVSVFAINVITLLGMGLAIDYALFVVSRFREELARRPGTGRADVNAAVAATMATAGRTVLFSGLTVAASLASLLIFPQNFLQSMGYGGIAAVLVAMTAALTMLPAVLAVLGPRVEFGRMPWRRRRRQRVGPSRAAEGAWARLAHSVMRRPVAYLVVIVLALLALGTPFLGAKFGSVDQRVLPSDAPSRVATQIHAREFGGLTSTANIVVSGADRNQLTGYRQALSQVPGVESVQTIDHTRHEGKSMDLLRVTWPGDAQTEASREVVQQLRGVDPGPGAAALVGGESALAVDLIDSVGAHLPWMGLLVVGVMLVLLFLAFGSVVLPVKAVAVNVLSLGASFGVVTWIFQEGHLSGLLGFTSPGYLDATQPILMLGILFGLSMDYEVFLLSRVREEWDRTGDNTAAVARGLQRSGGIITSAALLLAVVVAGFATSGIVFLKMIGVGMLVAVLLDATVVRALLVPAAMRLLGRANWWAPGPLRRWWERYGVHEAAGDDDGVVPDREPARV